MYRSVHLCIFASHSLLLISNKFWMRRGWGVGGVEASGPSWRGRIRGVKGGENRGGALPLSYFMHLTGPSRAIKLLSAPAPPPPTVWALKPLSWAPPCLGLSMANICVCTRRYAGMHIVPLVSLCSTCQREKV